MEPSHPKAPLDLVYASDDHFRTPRQTGLRGREFGPPDTDKSWYVAIVNEPAVRMLWPGADPLRHHLMVDKFLKITPAGEAVRRPRLRASMSLC